LIWSVLITTSDGNIRYFELENDKFEFLAEYKSADPQRGIAFMPKRGVNPHENEVTRAFKTVNDSYIEPISFIVPRRSENFQDDIYPPTIGLKPAMGLSEWFAGKEAIPPKISMASVYEGEGLKEVTGVQEQPTPTTSAPEPKAEPESKPAEAVATKKAAEPVSTPTPVIKPEVSMKEQGASMAAMVNKFADKEDDVEPVDDDSSFEEISKPTERTTRSADNASPSIKTSPWQQKEEAKSQASPAPVSFLPLNPPRPRTNQNRPLPSSPNEAPLPCLLLPPQRPLHLQARLFRLAPLLPPTPSSARSQPSRT
jgi:coronin-1B/1C/6